MHEIAVRSVLLLGFLMTRGAVALSADETTCRPRDPCPVARGMAAFKSLSEIQADPRIQGQTLPVDCSEALFTPAGPASLETLNRAEWSTTIGSWVPPEFVHQPLYFDDVPLERYGQTTGRWLQPTLSGVHFFSDVAALPLKILADHPHRTVSPLGYWRPGSAAPPTREKLQRIQVDPLWFHPLACRLSCQH